MKSKRPVARMISWLALALGSTQAPPATAEAAVQESGIVRGTIYNSATMTNLADAVVSVEGTDRSAVTDNIGRFQIEQVPAGAQTLKVIYPGLDPAVTRVSVTTGLNVVPPIGMTSKAYELDKFVVKGIREGNAAAFARQKEAPNSMTVMATDAFGDISDGNLGDFLKRLPGINGGGVGEVESIGIRGLGANHTSVTLDGVRLPSPDASGEGTQGDTRTFQIDKFPADYIESIELHKAPIPSMDADAIGGTVNLRTKSAFTARERSVTYRFGINHSTLNETNAAHGNISYSDMIGKNLGVVLTANYSKAYQDKYHSELYYDPIPDPVSKGHAIQLLRMTGEPRFRERTGLGLRFDYRLGSSGILNFGFVYNDYVANNQQNRYNLETETGPNAVLGREPGGNELRTVVGNLNAAGVVSRGAREWVQSQVGITSQEVFSWQGGGEYRLQSGWVIDGQGTFAPGKGIQERYVFNLMNGTRSTDVGGTTRAIIERSNLLDPFPTVTVTHGGLGETWNFTGGDKFTRHGDTDQRVWSGSINARKDFTMGIPFTFQTGLRYRGQRFWSDYYEDGRRNRAFDPRRTGRQWDDFKDPNYARPLFGLEQYHARSVRGMVWADPKAAYQYFQAHPEGWLQLWSPREVREAILNDGQVREEIVAGYLQSTFRFGKSLSVLAGARVEETYIDARGFVEDPAKAGAPPVASAGRDEWVDYYNRTFQVQKSNRKYRNVFPGVHARYQAPFLAGLVARASYSQGITRPSYGTLIPKGSVTRFAVDPDDDLEAGGTITLNNTGLLPQMSNNTDISLEYYFEPVGLISLSYFSKNIVDFIFTVDDVLTDELLKRYNLPPEFLRYRFRTTENRGEGEVRGWEFAYNQQLAGFSRWLRGVSVYGSYSWTRAYGDLVSTAFQTFVPDVVKVGVAYDRYPAMIRVHYNANSSRQTGLNSNPFLNQYRESEPDLELDLKYSFSKKFSVFAQFTNLLDTKIILYSGDPGNSAVGFRHEKYSDLGRKISFGISGRF